MKHMNIIKKQIDNTIPGYNPYIKKVNNQYIIQVASFADKTKAVNFKLELSDKGFPARITVKN